MANTTRAVKGGSLTASQVAEWKNPVDNPQQANAEIAAVLSETATLPVIDFPANDTVTLPGGLVRKDGLITTAQVKELTGEDEETLARASQAMNPFIFLDRLLRCGVVKVGSEPSAETEKLVSQMLIGDREALILGIRKATYGDKLEVEGWICTNCGVKSDLEMELDDIPVVKMTDPVNEINFKVPMRKGGFAHVRLATGADQLATFEQAELTQAQKETVLLSRCISTITTPEGRELSMAGFPSLAREMSVPDRHAVLKELRDRQPGPKYDQVKYKCESCSEDVLVAVTIGNLFLDFGWV
jgi:hypothetical protein